MECATNVLATDSRASAQMMLGTASAVPFSCDPLCHPEGGAFGGPKDLWSCPEWRRRHSCFGPKPRRLSMTVLGNCSELWRAAVGAAIDLRRSSRIFFFLLPICDEAREGLRIRSKSFPVSQWNAFRFQAHHQINGRYYWYPTPLR